MPKNIKVYEVQGRLEVRFQGKYAGEPRDWLINETKAMAPEWWPGFVKRNESPRA